MDTIKVKNYLQIQNLFAWIGFMAPVVMVFFLINFFPLPFTWEIVELIIYFMIPVFMLLTVVTSLFKNEIESGKDAKLLCLTLKISLYFTLLFYFFTFIYSIIAGNELFSYYNIFTMPNIVYITMYLLCFFSLIIAIKANSLLIKSLKK